MWKSIKHGTFEIAPHSKSLHGISFIYFLPIKGGRAHKMTSTTPKPQCNWDLSHGTNVLVIIVIMPSRWDSLTDRTRAEWSSLLDAIVLVKITITTHKAVESGAARQGSCKWSGWWKETVGPIKLSHNTRNNNKRSPLKPLALNRSTSPCKE